MQNEHGAEARAQQQKHRFCGTENTLDVWGIEQALHNHSNQPLADTTSMRATQHRMRLHPADVWLDAFLVGSSHEVAIKGLLHQETKKILSEYFLSNFHQLRRKYECCSRV